MEDNFVTWKCSCGTVYALERNVPTTLHKNHPERKKCGKSVTSVTKCGTAFPDQAKRDILFKIQNIVNEVE